MGCDVALLSGIKFFELLGEENRNHLADVIDYVKLAQGEPLFQAGDPGDSLFFVRSGSMELYIRDTTGQKIVLANVQEGDLFGELSLFDSGPRTATAVALTESELLALGRDDLLLLFQRKAEAALHMLAAMGTMTRKADELLRTRVSRNVNLELEETLTVFQKVADWIARFSGGMPFLVLNATWFIVWIVLNRLGIAAFDPYPFGLLTMIVSLEAIFLSIFVLISQNRQAEKDRVRADVDYEVNVKAELEVAHLHEKVDHMYEKMLDRFVRLEKMVAR